MKNSVSPSFVIFLLSIIFCFAQCKKEHNTLNITLYDKPVGTIQSYIQGNWKCHYGKGGIAANTIQWYNNYLWQFDSGSKIITTYNNTILADTTITWVKDLGTYTNGDSTFTMKFYDKQNVPWVYVVDRIIDDTLILHDLSSDAVFYHFTKL